MASSSSSSKSQPHVVIFPFMAQGHTIPLLDLSKAIASRGVQVTIITTPSNAPFIDSKTSNHHPQISLSVIPFPKVEELPEGGENTADLPSMRLFGPFVAATRNLKQPLENLLRQMSESNCLPICVITDLFLGWTLETCRSFNIPRIAFNGMGVLPRAILKYAFMNASSLSGLPDSMPFQISNLTVPFPVTKADLPPEFMLLTDPENPIAQMILRNKEVDKNSWGSIVNSFEELEGEYIPALESFYQKEARVWCVGPALLYDETHQDEKKQSCPYIKWLHQKQGFGSGAVIYVSFGSQAKLSDLQMDEIALGLEMAGQPFIWVIKSKTWVPPDGWTERTKDKGLVVRDWVDQRSILSHPAIGGFLSHCGWNSVLESLTAGVPLLAWPNDAEQKLNAKYAATGLRTGMILASQGGDEGEKMAAIDRRMISETVKKLMMGEEGRKARKRAKELGEMARKSVEKGGSSYAKLDELIECLTQRMTTS